VRNDVLLNVNTGRDFNELKTLRTQGEYTSFSDIQDVLSAFGCVLPAERPVFNGVDELLAISVVHNVQLTVGRDNMETTCAESAHEDNLLRTLTDIDEAAGSC
jgi:hypothetical protein